jgi:FdhE protein
MSQKILQPGEIEQLSSSEIPFLRLPQRASLFADRAARLRQLAPGHAMGDYLEFVARIADQQQWALQNLPPVMLPTEARLAQAREHGMPPLGTQGHSRDRAWCDVLRMMLRRLAVHVEGPARDIATKLEVERDELYEAQASKLLAGITFGLDVGRAPLIAAALQVYWVHLVTALGEGAFPRNDAPAVCPCCGSRPVASIVRMGAQEAGLRFLHCSLCSAEWHLARIQCTSCEAQKSVEYQLIRDGPKAWQAEACGECGTYLKIFYMEHDPQVEPCADDLASLALDLLVADTGKLRSGQNLTLFHGEEEA